MTRRDEARRLRERVRAAYCKPGETRPGVICLEEVNAPSTNRRADMLALHLTKARPFIDGIEIKVDRGDWLSELDQHAKADAWFPHTHRWWIAVPAAGHVVDPAELPHGWGLMAPDSHSDRRMKVVAKPDVRTPDLPYEAVRELLKKIDNQRAEQVEQQVEQARRELREQLAAREKQLQSSTGADDPMTQWQLQEARAISETLDMPLSRVRRCLEDPHTAELVRTVLRADDERRRGVLQQELSQAAGRHAAAATALQDALAAIAPAADQEVSETEVRPW